VGFPVGAVDRLEVGVFVGLIGLAVSSTVVGSVTGIGVGSSEGIREGLFVGLMSLAVGNFVGLGLSIPELGVGCFVGLSIPELVIGCFDGILILLERNQYKGHIFA